MKSNQFIKIAGALFFTCMFLGFIIPGAFALEVSEAPLNPEFVEYFEEEQQDKGAPVMMLAAVPGESEPHNEILGEIPSPVVVQWPMEISVSAMDISNEIPTESYFDLRLEDRVGSVKDQGDCGSCWAFAAMGSLESFFLTSENLDFSENNLKNTHGYNYGHDEGGNAYMATAYLSRWSGPVLEKDDPYQEYSAISPKNLKVQKHVQNVEFLPKRKDRSDVTKIKQAVKEYGGVYSSMYWSNGFYDSEHCSYFDPWLIGGGHAVLIVGWDDNYSKDNFSFTPPGDGAFIVRNSWGPEWGDDGYFYQSYYDADRGCKAVFTGEDTEYYTDIYQYDTLGWTKEIGLNSETAYFANVFTARNADRLGAVGFYTPSPDADYEVSIYNNPKNGPLSNKEPVSTLKGSFALPGYHTVDLAKSVILAPGEKFSVVVKLTTPAYTLPIAVESPIAKYSTMASANKGESFISDDGEKWDDLTKYYPDTNVCLKAFTIYESPEISLMPGNVSLKKGQVKNLDIVMSRSPRGLSGYELSIKPTDSSVVNIKDISFPKWATLNQNTRTDDKFILKAVDLEAEIQGGPDEIVLGTIKVEAVSDGKTGFETEIIQIDADGGDQITTTVTPNEINVLKPVREESKNIDINIPGLKIKKNNGTNRIQLNLTGTGAVVSKDKKNVTLRRESFDLTLSTGENTTEKDGMMEGNIRSIKLKTHPTMINSETGSLLSGSIEAELNNIPEGANIKTVLTSSVSDKSRNYFAAAASQTGLSLKDVACSMEVNLDGINDVEDIKEASVFISVPAEWVDSVGGSQNVKIIRIGDTGELSVLKTTFAGFDENGDMKFEGFSPEGFCEFGLVAVAKSTTDNTGVTSHTGSGGISDVSAAMTDSIKSGDRFTLKMSKTPVTELSFRAKENINELMITAEDKIPATSLIMPEGKLLSFVDIELYHTTTDKLNDGIIKFSVPKILIEEQKSSSGDVKLYVLNENIWVLAETVFNEFKDGKACFTATTDTLSDIAITISDDDSLKTDETDDELSQQNNDISGTDSEKSGNLGETKEQKSPLPGLFVLISAGTAIYIRKRFL